jgi:hypothetical protein
MQQIISFCMWHLMTKGCKMVIICFPYVFKKACAKVVDLKKIEERCGNHISIVKVGFPFFNVITHLLVH